MPPTTKVICSSKQWKSMVELSMNRMYFLLIQDHMVCGDSSAIFFNISTSLITMETSDYWAISMRPFDDVSGGRYESRPRKGSGGQLQPASSILCLWTRSGAIVTHARATWFLLTSELITLPREGGNLRHILIHVGYGRCPSTP